MICLMSTIEFYSKLSELASFRYLMGAARPVVGVYTTYFSLAVDPGAMTSGRARALIGAVVALISVVIGGLALARSAGRLGNWNGRTGAIIGLTLGLIGMVLSVVHLGTSTGGFGSGSGRAGAIVALVLGLIGVNLGGLALARSRRSRSKESP